MRGGQLTAAWDKHEICCALTDTMFPGLPWVSPHGDPWLRKFVQLDGFGSGATPSDVAGVQAAPGW